MRRLRSPNLLLAIAGLGASLSLLACDPNDGGDESTQTVDRSGDVPTTTDPTPEQLSDVADVTDWRAWAATRASELSQDGAEVYDTVMNATPRRGRDGTFRLRGPWIADADAAPVALHRFVTTSDAELRVSLADLVAHLDGVPKAALLELATEDGDARVRAAVTAELWRVSSDDATVALTSALADTDVQVRIAAAISAGRHPKGDIMVEELVAALADDDAGVRMTAARSISIVGSGDHVIALESALKDQAPEVRLAALRGVEKLDPNRAIELVRSTNLVEDGDPKVAGAASRILQP